MNRLRFYLDEMLSPEIGHQLQTSGIDVVSAKGLEQLGADDAFHLKKAASMGRALCTQDQDFLRLAAENQQHAGIVFAVQTKATFGGWVRGLRDLHEQHASEDLVGRVVFLKMES